MSFSPRFGFTPGKAHVGHGDPLANDLAESRPLPAKSTIDAPFEMEQLIDAAPNPVPQPKLAFVAEMAFCAFATFRKHA